MEFVKLSPDAFTPTKSYPNSAGYDLHSAYDYVINPQDNDVINTGIAIKLPKKCYGRIAPRSGIAWRYKIDIGAVVIDPDYRGEIGVFVFNHGKIHYE